MPGKIAVAWTLVLSAGFSLAEEPGWKSKPVEQWNPDEARQVLTDSPWAKSVKPEWLRDLSVDERRNGGDMSADSGHGVGLAGLGGILGGQREAQAVARAHAKPDPGTVLVRWESARPVRVAEKTAGESDAPPLDSEFYAIAVYDVPAPKRWNIENELKGIAALMRTKKKDMKPSRVVILRADKDDERATVVYLFKRSTEISKRDGNVIFRAQIGRLFVEQTFFITEMAIGDDLEL